MNEMTLKVLYPDQSIDPDFLKNIEANAEQYGYIITHEPIKSDVHLESKPKRISHEEFIRLSAELSRLAGPQPHDSADLIREDRDSR